MPTSQNGITWLIVAAVACYLMHEMVIGRIHGYRCTTCGTRTGDHADDCPWKR